MRKISATTIGNAQGGDVPVDVVRAAQDLNRRCAKAQVYHFCDPKLAFSIPIYGEILSLWRTKAGSRAMPAKSDISPRDLKSILSNVVVCQRVATLPSAYVWRLVGTKVGTIVGNVTGKTFQESAPAELVSRWTECCDLVLDGGQPLRFIGRVHIQDRDYLDAENFFLPLANDEGVPTFIMGLCRYTPRTAADDESWKEQIDAGALL